VSEASTLKPARPRGATADASLISIRAAHLAAIALVVVGAGLRLVAFLKARSLAQDEAQLALNLIDRPFGHLFGQLDFNQAAPPAFLAVQKLVVAVLGGNDYSLRLFPLLAGTAGLVLFYFLARRVVAPLALPLAVAVVALSNPTIFYTTADKQYAVDFAIAVLVLLSGMRLSDRRGDTAAAVVFACVGAAAIWLSHSSVFVLAGVSTPLAVGSLLRRDRRQAVHVLAAGAVWLASFGVFALTSLDNVAQIRHSLSHTEGAFAGSGSGLFASTGALRTSLGAFRFIAGIPHFLRHGPLDAGQLTALVAGCFCLVGLVSLLRKSPEKGAALICPLGFMLIAWGLGQYPLLGRTQLFLVPMFALLLAEGVAQAFLGLRHRSARAAAALAGVLFLVVMTVPAVGAVVRDSTFDEIKPVLADVAREQLPSDTVYVYYTAQPQLRYYLECRCAGSAFEAARKRGLWPLRRARGGSDQFAPAMLSVPPRLVVGQYRGRAPSLYARDFDALRGRKRVWFLVPEIEEPERTALLRELDRRGTRRETFRVGDVNDFARAVVAYRYDMTR
jgi:hypothetical protein